MRAACALTVSDTLSEEEKSEGTYMSLEDLEHATDTMIEVALEAGTAAVLMTARAPPDGPADPRRGQPGHDRGHRRAGGSSRRAGRGCRLPTVWAWDHFVSRGGLTDPLLECWTTLAAAAAMTTERPTWAAS